MSFYLSRLLKQMQRGESIESEASFEYGTPFGISYTCNHVLLWWNAVDVLFLKGFEISLFLRPS